MNIQITESSIKKSVQLTGGEPHSRALILGSVAGSPYDLQQPGLKFECRLEKYHQRCERVERWP